MNISCNMRKQGKEIPNVGIRMKMETKWDQYLKLQLKTEWDDAAVPQCSANYLPDLGPLSQTLLVF